MFRVQPASADPGAAAGPGAGADVVVGADGTCGAGAEVEPSRCCGIPGRFGGGVPGAGPVDVPARPVGVSARSVVLRSTVRRSFRRIPPFASPESLSMTGATHRAILSNSSRREERRRAGMKRGEGPRCRAGPGISGAWGPHPGDPRSATASTPRGPPSPLGSPDPAARSHPARGGPGQRGRAAPTRAPEFRRPVPAEVPGWRP